MHDQYIILPPYMPFIVTNALEKCQCNFRCMHAILNFLLAPKPCSERAIMDYFYSCSIENLIFLNSQHISEVCADSILDFQVLFDDGNW